MSAPPRRPRRALVVAYCFPPEASIGTHRPLRLVRRLVEEGWDVTVLTGTVSTYSESFTFDQELLSRIPPGVRVVRAPALRPLERLSDVFSRWKNGRGTAIVESSDGKHKPPGPARSRIARVKGRVDALLSIPDRHVGWVGPAVTVGLWAGIRHRPDVLYSTAPAWSAQLVARFLAAALRCPWVADFRDPWARAPWREEWLPAARRAAQALERIVVRGADAVVFTTRTNLEEFSEFYGGVSPKFYLVRNGCGRDEFEGLTPLIRDDRFTILHAGSMYGGRKPTALFSALAALRDRGVISPQTFCFRQIGRVALNRFDMAEESRRLGLTGLVELVDSQPRRQILREMLGASCLLLLQPGTTVSIPGKLFEYLAAGRPILAIAEQGELSDIVRSSGCGLAVVPDDATGIERAIEELVRGGMTSASRPSPQLFDGELRTGELVRILESVCERRGAVYGQPVEGGRDAQS